VQNIAKQTVQILLSSYPRFLQKEPLLIHQLRSKHYWTQPLLAIYLAVGTALVQERPVWEVTVGDFLLARSDYRLQCTVHMASIMKGTLKWCEVWTAAACVDCNYSHDMSTVRCGPLERNSANHYDCAPDVGHRNVRTLNSEEIH
jgi:hypothetical protein